MLLLLLVHCCSAMVLWVGGARRTVSLGSASIAKGWVRIQLGGRIKWGDEENCFHFLQRLFVVVKPRELDERSRSTICSIQNQHDHRSLVGLLLLRGQIGSGRHSAGSAALWEYSLLRQFSPIESKRVDYLNGNPLLPLVVVGGPKRNEPATE